MSQSSSWQRPEPLLPPSAALPPKYQPERLARLDIEALVDLMIADEDRVPRMVVDECADRGEEMIARLREMIAPGVDWNARISDGAWWLRLHAVMILGLMASEAAGQALVGFVRRIGEARDDALQDWVSGYWPALFRNKPPAVVPVLRELVVDRSLDSFVRAEALEAVTAAAERDGPQALESAIDWAAGFARDEEEDFDFRLTAGGLLLDFPRPRHRALLMDLAKRQPRIGAFFGADEVTEAYSSRHDEPQWHRFRDPWKFYEPQEIAERQARWDEEAKAAGDQAQRETDERSWTKVGRNDPCPCGSGQKYKKCCMSSREQ